MDLGWQGWLESAVVLALILGLLGALLTIWLILEGRQKACRIIYREIRSALDEAQRARGAGAIAAAEQLQGLIHAYLGPLFDLTSAKPIDQLRKAIEGRIKDPSKPVVIVTHTPGGASASAASAGGAASATAVIAPAGGTQVLVAPPPPPPLPDREASTREHVAEVQKALEAFDAFWTQGRVEDMLRRAQQALLIKTAIPVERDSGARWRAR